MYTGIKQTVSKGRAYLPQASLLNHTHITQTSYRHL